MPMARTRLKAPAPVVAKITEAVLKLTTEQAEFLASRLRLLDTGDQSFGEWSIETDKLIADRGWGVNLEGAL
jgi:hypothetical protein